MKQFLFCCLIIGFSLPLQAQTGESHFIRYQANLSFLCTDKVSDEADDRHITDDSVMISFIFTTDCKGKDLKIVRPGKLKSLPEEILKFSEKVMAEMVKNITCEQGKPDRMISLPLKFNYQ